MELPPKIEKRSEENLQLQSDDDPETDGVNLADSGTGQKSTCVTTSEYNVTRLKAPEQGTSADTPTEFVARPSTSSGARYKPDTLHPQTSTLISILHSSIQTHGVKRKFPGYHYEAKRKKRPKMYHTKNTMQTEGKKRRAAVDNSENTRKRFKSSPENSIKFSENEHSVSKSMQASKSLSDPNCDTIAPYSGSGNLAEGSTSVIDDKQDPDDSEDVQPCPRSCVCQSGPSQLPLFVERKFDTPAPLYKACLLRRIYSLSNTQYMCCKKRCVTKYSRERVMKMCLFHMEEDYYRSDLSVCQYKWGEWKD